MSFQKSQFPHLSTFSKRIIKCLAGNTNESVQPSEGDRDK